MSIIRNSNVTKLNDVSENIYNSKIIIAIIAFLVGVISVVLFIFLNKPFVAKVLFLSDNKNVKVVSQENIPTCISSDSKNAKDVDFIVYILKYNEMMKPRLQALLTKLSSEKYKTLVRGVLSRQEKETALMKSAYKSETGKEYTSANEKTSLLTAIPFPDDVLSGNNFTDEERISLLRGILEGIGNSYYSVVSSITKNTTLKENATSFFTFKADFVKNLTTK